MGRRVCGVHEESTIRNTCSGSDGEIEAESRGEIATGFQDESKQDGERCQYSTGDQDESAIRYREVGQLGILDAQDQEGSDRYGKEPEQPAEISGVLSTYIERSVASQPL